jgi:hypothetical protein
MTQRDRPPTGRRLDWVEINEQHVIADRPPASGEPSTEEPTYYEWIERLEGSESFDTLARAIVKAIREARATPPSLDVLADALPEDALIPYSDWSRESLARHILARLGGIR